MRVWRWRQKFQLYSENTPEVFHRSQQYLSPYREYESSLFFLREPTWRIRQKCVAGLSLYADRHKLRPISANTRPRKILVLDHLLGWDGIVEKTISRYCPFKSSGW
jgi:hypothetical protein